MQEFTTPMMKQYLAIKKDYQDCLLFYRMGDFYELFLDDANIGAKVLNITLTSRAKGKDGRIPMAGVPYHAVDSYLSKLVKAGHKVAICEQVSLPSKYGIIDRQVVRIVTPGTILDEKALEKKDNNYIISLVIKPKMVAISIADISTGFFSTSEIRTEQVEQTVKDTLARIHPTECILSEKAYNDPDILRLIKTEKNINIFPFVDWALYTQNAKQTLKKHFGVATLAGFALEEKTLAVETAAALLGYLQQTQKGPVAHIKKITTSPHDQHVLLDRSTILNLELFSTIRQHETQGTLLAVIDQTITAMGGRLLKNWMRTPLTEKSEVEKRHEAVEFFCKNRAKRELLREKIKEVSDIERMLSRLSVGLGNARDLINLKMSLQIILDVREVIKESKVDLIEEIAEGIRTVSRHSERSPKGEVEESPTTASQTRSLHFGRDDISLEGIISIIQTNIAPEPPISLREGGLIAQNINKELDKLRKIVGGSKDWIVELEKKEREHTGIASLKVRFNKVFGFYIEISKSNLSSVPKQYMRKQTLVNGERFITPELKEQEEIILTAEQKINDLEYALFQDILKQVLDQTTAIQEAAQSIAMLDCLLNFAHIAEKNKYVRPTLLSTGEIHITCGRHPVVENLLEDKQFVPNDVNLDNNNQQLLLITGPNMAGKSVFIRQVALIVLLSQMGSFVPADKAELSLVDRIFVRSGASDVITSGLSTFMVEMVETAYILHHATEKSLIIMDEIGRGTSTYDGISIAWAVAEYLVSNKQVPKTLFATHYHELQVLEERFPNRIKNFHMEVVNDREEPIFLHTILPGGASHSFGVAVAKLAGIPESVIKRANELLEELENSRKSDSGVTDAPQNDEQFIQQTNLVDHLIHKELESIDIHQMTPLEALNKLSELKEKLKVFSEFSSPFKGEG